MDTTSSVRDSDLKEHQSHEAQGEEIGSMEPRSADPDHVDSGKSVTSGENNENIRYNSGNVDTESVSGNNSSKSACKRKKVHQKMRGSHYLLRSVQDRVRVLRSMSKGKDIAPTELASTPVNPVTEKKRKKKQIKKSSNDEFSKTRKRVRYLLTRMNYEQSLLDAYSGEGWKGQSLEKIRPEKELERAKSEILRCKLRIRELFRHLDSLLSEGRLEESLFDAEGEISSEDILCAKCGSKDLSADNDIILCDGMCNRGFHQKCLSPPLLSEDIPPGDIGWLCPACDCKVDCIDFLNEFQGIDLSIEDMWEKVFPEATIANGDKQFDYLGLPSDDSEDDDYNPDAPAIDVENQKDGSESGESGSGESSSGESTSGESYFTCSSGHSDPGASNHDMQYDTLGLPSDDSEDDDYNPDGPDPAGKLQKDGSSLDASDFTSDSDEFMEELNKTSVANDGYASSLSNLKPLDLSGEGRRPKEIKKSSMNSEPHFILEPDTNKEIALLVSGKRQRERLDYKKLYDEEYGEASSDSRDDDEWSGMTTSKKGKTNDTGEGSVALPKENFRTTNNRRSTRSSKGELTGINTILTDHSDQLQVPLVVNTPNKTHQKLDSCAASHPAAEQHSDSMEPDSSGKKGTASTRKSLGGMVSQRLLESFKENQYPKRDTKESLAKELGRTVRQVSKWFEKARHNARAVAEVEGQAGVSTPTKGNDATKTIANDTGPEKTGRSSHRNRGKEEKSDRLENSNARAALVISNGDEMETVENNRQKAIARELRKRKKSR